MSEHDRRPSALASIRSRVRGEWQEARRGSRVSVRARWACRVLGALAVGALAVFTDLPALSVLFLGLLATAGALWVVDSWQAGASTD